MKKKTQDGWKIGKQCRCPDYVKKAKEGENVRNTEHQNR